mmetsp:Transcript_52447/g.170294  ORF Transcript_52447/g.170294 Transcript_52447/m.170294 type:complete len:231 (-) Transcript_52447:615-1307(-)
MLQIEAQIDVDALVPREGQDRHSGIFQHLGLEVLGAAELEALFEEHLGDLLEDVHHVHGPRGEADDVHVAAGGLHSHSDAPYKYQLLELGVQHSSASLLNAAHQVLLPRPRLPSALVHASQHHLQKALIPDVALLLHTLLQQKRRRRLPGGGLDSTRGCCGTRRNTGRQRSAGWCRREDRRGEGPSTSLDGRSPCGRRVGSRRRRIGIASDARRGSSRIAGRGEIALAHR